MKIPGGQRAVLRRARENLDHAGWPEVGPSEFFLAGPHDLHRLTGGFGQSCSFDRRIDGVLAAITCASVGNNHAHAVRRKAKSLSQLSANAERLLRAGPDRQLAVLPLRD